MTLVRFFWLAVFVLFVGIASFLAEELFFPFRPSFHQDSIEWKIHEDLRTLEDQNLLPPEMKSVHEVFVADRRQQPQTLNWAELSKFHFPQKTTGKFDLQIEIFEPDSTKKGSQLPEEIFLQFSLFEKESKNKIWEMSRNYRKLSRKKSTN